MNYKLGAEYTNQEYPYATYFLQYIGFAAQVPNVIFNWLNIFLNNRYGLELSILLFVQCRFALRRGSLTSRIVWTLMIEVVLFVVTIVLAMIDSSNWPGIFFYITILSVIILNSEKHIA